MGLYLVLLLGGPAFMWMILGVSTNMTCLKKYHLGKTYRQCAQQWNQNHCFIMGAINQWDTICKAYSSNHNQVASNRACAQDDSVQQLLDSACVPGVASDTAWWIPWIAISKKNKAPLSIVDLPVSSVVQLRKQPVDQLPASSCGDGCMPPQWESNNIRIIQLHTFFVGKICHHILWVQ